MKYIKTKSDYQDKVQHSCYTPTVIADALKEHNIQLTRQRKDVITEMCRLRKVEDAETLWMHLIRDRKISVAAV
ncbi:MAG TPA: hypothetical protein PKA53_07200, partial [Sphingobacterium sp.]|nr:hypothetical protein [Sphingobacterium sp.]